MDGEPGDDAEGAAFRGGEGRQHGHRRVRVARVPAKGGGGRKGSNFCSLKKKVSGTFFWTYAQPPMVGCKVKAQSEHVRVAYTFFARLGADLHAQSALIDETFCVGAQEEVFH